MKHPLPAVMLLLSCAVPASAQKDKCPLSKSDSAFIKDMPLYRECAVDQRAKPPAFSPRLEFTPRGAGSLDAVVQVVVGVDGQPETDTARLQRGSRELGEAIMRSLSLRRYTPAMKDGVPVRQIVTIEERLTVELRSVQVR